MTNAELCAAISRLTGDSPLTTERVIRAMRQIIFDEVSCLGTVHLAGLGKFQGMVQAGRKQTNALKYGAISYVPERITFRFSTSETARDKLDRLTVPKQPRTPPIPA